MNISRQMMFCSYVSSVSAIISITYPIHLVVSWPDPKQIKLAADLYFRFDGDNKLKYNILTVIKGKLSWLHAVSYKK